MSVSFIQFFENSIAIAQILLIFSWYQSNSKINDLQLQFSVSFSSNFASAYINFKWIHNSNNDNFFKIRCICILQKLFGAQNYRSWRRSMEIALSTKRKLGFVTGSVIRPVNDPNQTEFWDTCNNMVISWIMSSVSESIVKSIMFVDTASAIWKQLEKMFALSNGSRKYKLHEDTYSCDQNGISVSENYTKMKCIWEEIDSMSELPRVTNVTPEITNFLNALKKQKEEEHLFQFLNGLDEQFSALRSQMLLMSPLPGVEVSCSMLQQEESQREMFTYVQNQDMTALYSKSATSDDKCTFCGHKWHSPDKCWEKIGYPPWHYKGRLNAKRSHSSQEVCEL
ncbi:uncharacterized protein [Rutidosis leptorrhynchoides]|uniref:uncharacterized protein n=1 Tax=Rutidosis leptorrhynchoides TaxID=125765 RepID=UPI003A9A53A8